MQNEIAAGIHNALERGETLDHAIQTFVNSGYNPQEVQAAAQLLASEGMTSIIDSRSKTSTLKPLNVEDNSHTKKELATIPEPNPQAPNQPVKKSKTFLILGILLGVLVLIGALGAIIWLMI